MNLLRDPWIPVQSPTGIKLISLEQLLCSEEQFSLCLPRDDMEMSTLQLAICLTQVCAMPETLKELRDRIKQPMSEVEYRQRSERLVPWFQLDHPKWPFMQTLGVTAADVTPIQKLLPGLPEGNNHCFFNSSGEIRFLCSPMVAVTLFQQATMTPGFGGGFKSPLRGSAPITTLVWSAGLREMVWSNVLSHESLANSIPNYDAASEHELPTWVRPIEKEEQAEHIGLLRGLFWQPAHVQVLWQDCAGLCDLLGIEGIIGSRGFIKEKFNFAVQGVWPHPHSPREIGRNFMSFRNQVPSWTQCHSYVYKEEHAETVGHIPASVVTQAHVLQRGKELHLLLGGYSNNQANVIERRHEMISLGEGWEIQDADRLKNLLDAVLEAKKILRGKMLWLRKANPQQKMRGLGVSLADAAERNFYQETEQLIRKCFQSFTFQEAQTFKKELINKVGEKCMKIFDELVDPYSHDPGMMSSIVVGRRNLGFALRDLASPAGKKQSETKEVKKSDGSRKK